MDSDDKKYVLVIDDDNAMTNLISGIVQLLGHRTVTAFDMERGLAGFRAGFYDLVITDIFMEGTGGIEGIQQIRKIDRAVPIIAISAGYSSMTSEATLKAAAKIGADHIVPKPFKPENLQALISQILDPDPGKFEYTSG